jgi:hypothetical protein
MEGNNEGHICTTWYLWKVGVKPSYIHCHLSIYLQFVERKHLHTALFNWMHSFNSGQENAQMAVHEWYHNTSKE